MQRWTQPLPRAPPEAFPSGRGAFVDQQDLRDFEKDLAAYSGARYALGVADGTDALIIAAICAGLQAGDEVIFCSHTMVATAAWHRWLALYEGVKIGDRVVGYAAEECRRITAVW